MMVLILPAACRSDDADSGAEEVSPPELPFEYATEHLVVHSDIERCAGDFARWDGFVEFAVAYLDEPTPEEPLEIYVWEASNFDGEALCGYWTGGCFYESTGISYASSYSVEHELVHSLTRDYATWDSFFVEGLAEALSGANQFGHIGPIFPVRGSSHVEYASAGHFVRWLLETRGRDLLVMHMNGNGGVAQFEDIYGVAFDTLTEAYYTTASWLYPRLYRYPANSLEIEAEKMWSSELEFSCDRDDVRGTKDGLMVVRELTILETDYYAFWTSAGGPIIGARVDYPKDEADFNPTFGHGFNFPADQITVAPISAGVYEIGIVAAGGVDTGVVMVWKHASTIPVPPEAFP